MCRACEGNNNVQSMGRQACNMERVRMHRQNMERKAGSASMQPHTQIRKYTPEGPARVLLRSSRTPSSSSST